MRGAVLTVLACLVSSSAAAATGEQHRVAVQPSAALRDAQHRSDLRITIWYPAKPGSHEQSIDFPPAATLFTVGSVAADAVFADSARHPVVLLSHGYGGSARVMGWFGLALAQQGYVVIAVDHPGNNGVDPQTAAGSVLWWDRADDLRLALTTVLADTVLASHVDGDRIAVAGFSIGGLTALVAGGARTDPARMVAFCKAHPKDGTCKPQIEFPLSVEEGQHTLDDPALAHEKAVAGADHALPGVKAVFVMAPVIQPLTPSSLRAMRVPVAIVVGREDVTVPAATHAEVAHREIPRSALRELPGVTHYSFLATCSDAARATLLVCRHATNQDRAHNVAVDTALALFGRALR